MATDREWARRIGERIRELRDLKRWSLADLSRRTLVLSKSRLSNYEQGLRLPGPEEAVLLGQALGEAPAHILCLDDGMPALSREEATMIANLRALPESERAAYFRRIASLATVYKDAVPDERLLETGYSPSRRPTPKTPVKTRR